MKELLDDPDGYYKPALRPSEHTVGRAFAKDNGGSIPSNLLSFPNTESASHYLRACRLLGATPHPARFPSQLPRFFVRFLTEPGDVVVDIFSGSNTTGRVAEEEGRRWLSCELHEAYARLSAVRFMEGWADKRIAAAWQRLADGHLLELDVTSSPSPAGTSISHGADPRPSEDPRSARRRRRPSNSSSDT